MSYEITNIDKIVVSGWWRRACVYLLRIVIPTSLLSQLIGTVLYRNSSPDGWRGSLLLGISFVSVCCITNIFAHQGISWADNLLHTQVYSLRNGKPASNCMLVVRDLLHVLDFCCFVGFLLPLVNSHKQTIADLITGTIVIYRGTEK